MYRGGGFTPQRGWARVFHARKGRRWEAAFSPPQICRPLSREPLLGTGGRATQEDPGRRPPGALARAGHGRQRAPARPLSARLPPTPHPVPHPAPRQPGGGVSQGRQRRRLRLAPGRGGGRGGGEEGKTPARPALPSGPREGAAGTRHSLPGDARGGVGRGRSCSPSWAGPLPLPPGAGEPIRPPRPLLQDPMTQRREQGGGAWDGSFLTGPVPPPLRFHLASPHLRFFLRHLPLLQNSLPGKENRNQEEGVLGEKGAVLHPLSAKTPRGQWE